MAQRLTDYAEPAARAIFARRHHLHAWLTYPAWGTLLAVLFFSRFFPGAALRWQFVPFLLGMVFLGLPHGALDHLAPLLIRRRRLTPTYLLCFMLGYLACVAAYFFFWRILPLPALAVFLLLSWLHWGQGDAYFLDVFAGRPAHSTVERLTRWLVRGGLPIVLPILAFPHVFAQVAGGILGWYGGAVGWQMGGHWRTAGLIALGALTAAYLWQSWRNKRVGFWADAGEIGLMAVYFAAVPPILAVGVYFCVWHSARHLVRLMLWEEKDLMLGTRADPAKQMRRIAVQALPMTAGALVLLAGLFWGQGRFHVSAGSFVYLYLSLIAALTFPHFLLVLWMDREELIQQRSHPIRIGSRSDAPGNGF